MHRSEVEALIAYAIREHIDLRPQSRRLDQAAPLAKAIVDHLLSRNVEFSEAPPRPLHSTP